MPAPHEGSPDTPDPEIRQAVITLPDEIDLSNASQIHDALIRALDDGTAVLIADAAGTMFCGSATVTTLLRVHDRAAAAGAQLRIAASPAMRRVLQLIGADSMLRVYPTVAAALAAKPHPVDQTRAAPPEPDGLADPVIQ